MGSLTSGPARSMWTTTSDAANWDASCATAPIPQTKIPYLVGESETGRAL